MSTKNIITLLCGIIPTLFFFQSCSEVQNYSSQDALGYPKFKDSITAAVRDAIPDHNNFFETNHFVPGHDSVQALLIKIDSAWHDDLKALQFTGTSMIWYRPISSIAENLFNLKENIVELDYFLVDKHRDKQENCREKNCYLYAEVIKSTQTLYLYLNSQLIDSFPVSTGLGKYETPTFNVRPSGPLLRKYTSKKFPGGNYQGLGNMPYAVFIKGGYAIHGTTPGNFSKLGHRASHGCIRLHPLNAQIFFEMVKLIGLDNTWVSIKDSIPISLIPIVF